MTGRGVCLSGAFLLAVTAARAEVTVVNGRAETGTPAFTIDNVPPPSKSDAGTGAKFTVVDGRRDGNGGNVEVLNDGQVPASEDQPRANFFFAAGTDGGRIVADLGAAIDVKQVNTYSWHPGARGPQVYTLYGSDGSGGGFEAAPARSKDPQQAGWKRIAAVDTRGGAAEGARGQHGVSIADPAGTLGKFRYLLFDVSPTEKEDDFGNTFYSEIDIADAAATEAPVAATAASGRGGRGGGRNLFNREGPMDPNGPPPLVARTEAGHEIVFDYSAAPDLKEWVETKLRPVCVEWYPKIVAMLPSDGYEAPRRVHIAFSNDYRGVAAAGGNRIVCAVGWFQRNLEGEAAGAVVHELVHVVQQYRRPREGFTRNPGWLVEGLADWIRWFNYEPQSLRPRPRPDRAKYNDSYRTTGHFLDFVVNQYDKDIIRRLNATMREGRYSEGLWKELTGKTAEELGEEWKQTLPGAQ